LILALVVGVALIALFMRRPGSVTPEVEVAAPAVLATSAAQSETAAPTTGAEPAAGPGILLPLDGKSFEAFQKATSRITVRLAAENGELSYAVTASRALLEAITEVGHDADRTVQYWLSTQFAADLAAGNPNEAVSTRRTVDNLVSVLLGDQAGPEDFEQILAGLSPDVRALAIQRRARR
jgi:hypothetical protein